MAEQKPAETIRARGAVNRFLDVVERAGKALPDPTTLFALLALGVVLLSGLAAELDLMVMHPTTGMLMEPVIRAARHGAGGHDRHRRPPRSGR